MEASMRRAAWTGPALVVATLSLIGVLLPGCAGGGAETGAGGDARNASSSGSASSASSSDDRVAISAAVTSDLNAWSSREASMIGDVVEIDCTRVPFAAQVVVEVTRDTDSQGRRLIERTDTSDPATGVATLTLVNRSGDRTSLEKLPKVRVNGNRLFVAGDRLVLRYVPSDGAQRPVGISVTATGNARLLEADPPRRVAAPSITIRGEIVPGPGGWMFQDFEGTNP